MDEKAVKKFEELLRSTNRPGIDDLICGIEEDTDFFLAPASTKYHGAYVGGLLQHSLDVLQLLQEEPLSDQFSQDSIIIVALLHDLCKANCYVKETRNVKEYGKWVEKEVYTYQDDLPLGHGEKSLYLVGKHLYLSDEEAAAIRWHMGAFDCAFRGGDKALNAAFEKYPLAVLLHIADMKSTYLFERDWGIDMNVKGGGTDQLHE